MPLSHFSRGTLLFLLLLLQLSLLAQNRQSSRLYQLVQPKQQQLLQKGIVTKMVLFQKAPTLQLTNNNIPDSIISRKTILSLNKSTQSTLLRSSENLVALEIPVAEKKVDLVLMKQEMSPKNNSVLSALQKMPGKSAHYRGYIDGDSSSLAAFSVFEDGSVVGLFADKTGNYVLTKVKGSDEYIVYNDLDLKKKQPFVCGIKDEALVPSAAVKERETGGPSVTGFAEMQCRKVRCYWETDYRTYLNFNSDYTATENYVLALFNQLAALYQNEGITIELSAYKIWTTDDPYSDDNTGAALANFQSFWNARGNNYDGDLAYLICGKYDAGYATINNLCSRSTAYGVYGMNLTTIYPWQTYSWDVQATAHEHGHLLGSHHTQWCGWNTAPGGTCGAIDNCFPGEGAGGCSTCSFSTFNDADPVDAWRGTIMSYCHLRSRGILMINGFGPLPGDVIRSNVTGALCLQPTGTCPDVCLAPTSLSSGGTSYTDRSEITCTWSAVPGVSYYDFEYKKLTDAQWIVISAVPASQYKVTVDGGTNYLFRVKTHCANLSSPYSIEYLFRAACVPGFPITVANITPTSALISWVGNSGAKTHTLEYKKASDNAWTIIDGIVDASRLLSGLDANTAYNYRMKRICVDEESFYSTIGTFRTLEAPLPLVLSNFKGAHVDNDNVLHWTTHDEVNTSKFEIEFSEDNARYQIAGTVAAAGNSSSSLQYNFTHKNISTDAYYRIKMIDIDGSFAYSNTIFIKGNDDQKACVLLNDGVYPIPFDDKLTMNIYSCVAQTAKIVLRSIDGKLLRNETISLKKGTASYELSNLSSLSSGSYSVQIIPQKGDVIVRKVVKR